MHFYQSLVSLAALSTVSSANPIHLAKREGRFSVSSRQTKHAARIGAVANRKTYLKYGVTVPEHIHHAAENAIKVATSTKAASVNGTGTVAAEPAQSGAEYLSPVNVGGTQMMLDFDTGSADLWVYSSLQPSSQTQGHATYNANAADAAQGETWEIQYGDGSGASGDVYTGTVEIGGVTATSQAIEAATSVSTQFQQDTNNDGLVGLAFSTINQVQPQPQQTFFDNIKGQLESPLFTAALKDDAAGSYDFGFIDNSKYTGQITYADVDNSNGFWEFEADGYSVGSGSSSSTPFNAILDTGTSLMYLPTAAVEAYYSQVSGAQMNTQQGGYTFDCSATLPDASVTVGGTQFTVPGSLINYAETGDGSCFGGLQDAAGLPYMIFGDVFLKATFAVFDSQGPRIGLAPQSGVSSNATGGGSSTSSPSSTLSSSPLLPSSTGSSPFSLPSSTGSSPSLPSSTGTGSGHHHHHGGSGTGTQDGGDSGSDPFAGIFGSEGGIGDDSSLSDLIGELMDGDSAQSSKRKVPTRLGRPAAVASSKS